MRIPSFPGDEREESTLLIDEVMLGMSLSRISRRVVGSFASSKRSMSGFSLTAPRTLNEIAKVDMLEQETPEAVKAIWAEFHQDPSLMAIATSMSGAQHEMLLQRVAKCPHFIFPVFASKEAYYLMFSQVHTYMHACITRAATRTITATTRLTSVTSAINTTNTSLIINHMTSITTCDHSSKMTNSSLLTLRTTGAILAILLHMPHTRVL